eukprot:1817809-Rhodomonas_salina.2
MSGLAYALYSALLSRPAPTCLGRGAMKTAETLASVIRMGGRQSEVASTSEAAQRSFSQSPPSAPKHIFSHQLALRCQDAQPERDSRRTVSSVSTRRARREAASRVSEAITSLPQPTAAALTSRPAFALRLAQPQTDLSEQDTLVGFIHTRWRCNPSFFFCALPFCRGDAVLTVTFYRPSPAV